jgi:hypothetical protein
MRKRCWLAGLAVVAANVVAADGVAAPLRGGVIGSFRGADSVLHCEHIGKVTIRQIYEKGFSVVHMQDDKNTASYAVLVIEEQAR